MRRLRLRVFEGEDQVLSFLSPGSGYPVVNGSRDTIPWNIRVIYSAFLVSYAL